MEGRPKEKVAEVIGNITTNGFRNIGCPSRIIRVLVTEIPKTHWGKLEPTMAEKKIINQMNKSILKNPKR